MDQQRQISNTKNLNQKLKLRSYAPSQELWRGMSRLSESVFNGVAQSLIGRGIPGVVAMTYSIRVDAAADFAESFYLSLGERESLVVAFRRGQSAIGIEGNQWYRPVLYLRWADNEGGQLFSDGMFQPLSSDKVIPGKLTQRELINLQQELEDLLEEREACKDQYRSTIDNGQKVVLKRKLNKLDRGLNPCLIAKVHLSGLLDS